MLENIIGPVAVISLVLMMSLNIYIAIIRKKKPEKLKAWHKTILAVLIAIVTCSFLFILIFLVRKPLSFIVCLIIYQIYALPSIITLYFLCKNTRPTSPDP